MESCVPNGGACTAYRAMDECLNETLFTSQAEAKYELEYWKQDYNYQRPHSSLGYMTPNEFASKISMDKLAA